jgi:hypothetical protein
MEDKRGQRRVWFSSCPPIIISDTSGTPHPWTLEYLETVGHTIMSLAL